MAEFWATYRTDGKTPEQADAESFDAAFQAWQDRERRTAEALATGDALAAILLRDVPAGLGQLKRLAAKFVELRRGA